MLTTQITVRGYHLDVYQHVNNARYLEFLEEARWQYFQEASLLVKLSELNLAFVLVNINISYRRPALIHEELEIRSQVSEIGNKSCVMEQTIYLKGTDTQIIDGKVTFCVVDQTSQKAVPLKGELYNVLKAETFRGR